MIGWLHITIITVSGLIILLLLFLLFQPFLHPKSPLQSINQVNPISNPNSNDGVSPSYFFWADHPSLVAEAVENGWTAFRLDAVRLRRDETDVDFGREVCEDSPDECMPELVRLKKTTNSCTRVIRTALPLPGPRFGNSFFPQRPYFEITVCELAENECVLLTVGLTAEAHHLPLKCRPGRIPGSIGFDSTGSVYVNGRKLVFESKDDEWGRPEDVIGCGYNPTVKRIFFTLNSRLVHVIRCTSQEFGHPLFPTIAAEDTSSDVTLKLNLGQNIFRFEPENSQRTPNPARVKAPKESYSSIGFEDSADLFSLDSLWQHWAVITSNNNTVTSHNNTMDFDQESDLFEIHLGH